MIFLNYSGYIRDIILLLNNAFYKIYFRDKLSELSELTVYANLLFQAKHSYLWAILVYQLTTVNFEYKSEQQMIPMWTI